MERKYKSGYKRTLIAMGSKESAKEEELANFLLFMKRNKGWLWLWFNNLLYGNYKVFEKLVY